jgi:hypothetical protein
LPISYAVAYLGSATVEPETGDISLGVSWLESLKTRLKIEYVSIG